MATYVSIVHKCMTAFIVSGFHPGDYQSYPTMMNDGSLMKFHLTGHYRGADAISEYVAVFGGDLMGPFQHFQSGPKLMNFRHSTHEECVFWSVTPTRVKPRAGYGVVTDDDTTTTSCYDFIAGSVIKFTMTDELSSGILIHAWNVYSDDDLMAGAFGLIDTVATAQYVCHVLETHCQAQDSNDNDNSNDNGNNNTTSTRLRRRGLGKGKKKKKDKTKKKSKDDKETTDIDDAPAEQVDTAPITAPVNDAVTAAPITTTESCVDRLLNLDATTENGMADGNSRICRILHANYAKRNAFHCPHVTFDEEADANGDVKCMQSKMETVEDIFTEDELAYFRTERLPYGDNNLTHMAHYGSCPDV